MKTKHPMQPVFIDEDGIARFRGNPIVRFLYDWAVNKGMGMNELIMMPFENEDREHFAQLIGYSICGYGELSYVSDKSYAEAEEKVSELKNSQLSKKRKK